jgi:hypothetical protein
MQLARLIAIAVALLAVLAAVSLAAPAQKSPRADGASRAVRDFPVWRSLPTNRYATLSDRLVGSKRWALYLFKANPQGSPRRVCLQAFNVSSAARGVSVLTSRPECGLLRSERSFVASQSEVAGQSAIGVVTANASIASIEAELVPEGSSDHPTKTLSRHQRRKSGLPPLVYSAFVDGGSCLESLKGLDSEGRTVFGTGSRGCSGS